MYTVIWYTNEAVRGVINMEAVKQLAARRGATVTELKSVREGFEIFDLIEPSGEVVGLVITFNPLRY